MFFYRENQLLTVNNSWQTDRTRHKIKNYEQQVRRQWHCAGAVNSQLNSEYQCLKKGYRTYCKCRPLPVSCLQFSKTNVQSILNALLVNYESSMKCNQVKGIFQNEVIKLTSSFTAIEHALTYGQSPCPFTEVPSF